MAGRFRRNPYRKPLHRQMNARLNAHPILRTAHTHYELGEFDAAAEAFDLAARQIQAQNGLVPPQLLLKAGNSRILGGQVQHGLDQIKEAVQILARRMQYPKIYANVHLTLELLQQKGLSQEAAELSVWAEEYFPGLDVKRRGSNFRQAPANMLPTTCSACSGRVHPDEVDWINERQVECAYCGTVLQVLE